VDEHWVVTVVIPSLLTACINLLLYFYFNHLRRKCNPFYLKIQLTLVSSGMKTNRLMLCRENIIFFCDTHKTYK
jgi:hypothetical protein